MLIPLSDPIWSRLHGPYGVQDVPGILGQLAQHWHADLARTLFWERLFHQDDLYPVTFAALPWLWHCVARRDPPDREALIFLSMVLLCAGRRDGGQGRYQGLSLAVMDHAKPWLPAEIRLRAEDMPVLAHLEAWFDQNAEAISAACLDAVTPEDTQASAVLCAGFCGLRGSRSAAQFLQMWADGHDLETIRQDVRLDAQDIATLIALWHKVKDQSPDIATVIEAFTGFRPPDRRQLDLGLG